MTYTPPLPDNSDDIIDSRDVIFHLEALHDEIIDATEDADGEADPETVAAFEALQELAEDGETLEDWEHGVMLIRDSYFVTYAQEFAEDIGAIDSDAGWPAYCIDWERAASELRVDYTPVEFEGVTYWAR